MERQQKAYKGVIDYFKKKILDGELRPWGRNCRRSGISQNG